MKILYIRPAQPVARRKCVALGRHLKLEMSFDPSAGKADIKRLIYGDILYITNFVNYTNSSDTQD